MSNLSGVAHPHGRIRRSMGIVRAGMSPAMSLGAALEHTLAIDALSTLLIESVKKCRTADGRVDSRDVAHAVMVCMGQIQAGASIASRIDDATAVGAFARLLTEAIDKRAPDGRGDWRDVAAHVLVEMKGHGHK